MTDAEWDRTSRSYGLEKKRWRRMADGEYKERCHFTRLGRTLRALMNDPTVLGDKSSTLLVHSNVH